MNRDEAKSILLLYRPDLGTEGDPQITDALNLAKADPELARWLDEHCARQRRLRGALRSIAAPEGLQEQIVSEERARLRRTGKRRNTLVAALVVVSLLAFGALWFSRQPSDTRFSVYQNRMVSNALRGYAMDLMTHDAGEIRAYLANKAAPANYVLPAPLQHAEAVGCSVQTWNGASVSMICFRTGKPLPPGDQSDLWLFVVDRNAVDKSPESSATIIAPVKGLITAVWTQGASLYLLGTAGDENTIRQYLADRS